jgi:hypothetical protein
MNLVKGFVIEFCHLKGEKHDKEETKTMKRDEMSITACKPDNTYVTQAFFWFHRHTPHINISNETPPMIKSRLEIAAIFQEQKTHGE